MDELLNVALSQGLGYGMFVVLLVYVLKQQEKRDSKSEERETKYQEIISILTEKFSTIESDVKEIKNKLFN